MAEETRAFSNFKDAQDFIDAVLAISPSGISQLDVWVKTSAQSSEGLISTNLARLATNGYKLLGGGMTQASGIFTFPVIGLYRIKFKAALNVPSTADPGRARLNIQATLNNSTYVVIGEERKIIDPISTTQQTTMEAFAIFNVTDLANRKVRFTWSDDTSGGDYSLTFSNTLTSFSFERIAAAQ